jgi:hypothetical protein
MEQYINDINGEYIGTTFEQKCHALHCLGADKVDVDHFEENLVCVIDHGPFASASYAFNRAEFDELKSPENRIKQWFVVENAAEHVE